MGRRLVCLDLETLNAGLEMLVRDVILKLVKNLTLLQVILLDLLLQRLSKTRQTLKKAILFLMIKKEYIIFFYLVCVPFL